MRKPHLFTFVMASGVGALGMNVYLPSLPGIAEWFDVDYALAQASVSLYLAATAVLQLVYGPLSDRFGRRPVMIIGFALMLLGSLVCLYAPSIEIFLLGRVIQGSAVAGLVISRAAIRDVYGAKSAASVIGYVTMGMAVVPMLAPTIGGYLEEIHDWHGSFWLMAGMGAFMVVLLWFDMSETNTRKSTSFGDQFRQYPQLLQSRRFLGYCLIMAFSSGAFFAFFGGAPYVAEQHFHLRPAVYGRYFGISALGYIVGNYVTGRYANRIGIPNMLRVGTAITASGLVLALVLYFVGLHHPMAYFGPMVFIGVGNGMVLPSAAAGIVNVRPHLAGSASGLGGSLQIGGGAALSVLAGLILGPDTGPTPLLWLMLASALAAMIAVYFTMKREHEVAPANM